MKEWSHTNLVHWMTQNWNLDEKFTSTTLSLMPLTHTTKPTPYRNIRFSAQQPSYVASDAQEYALCLGMQQICPQFGAVTGMSTIV